MIVEYKENVEYEKIRESKSSIGFHISAVKFRDIWELALNRKSVV